jgi:hypothetical protein
MKFVLSAADCQLCAVAIRSGAGRGQGAAGRGTALVPGSPAAVAQDVPQGLPGAGRGQVRFSLIFPAIAFRRIALCPADAALDPDAEESIICSIYLP